MLLLDVYRDLGQQFLFGRTFALPTAGMVLIASGETVCHLVLLASEWFKRFSERRPRVDGVEARSFVKGAGGSRPARSAFRIMPSGKG